MTPSFLAIASSSLKYCCLLVVRWIVVHDLDKLDHRAFDDTAACK
jgi:hypothetical protein